MGDINIENICYGLSTAGCFIFTKSLGYRLSIYGEENIPQGKAIIASNHSSYLDPIFLGIGLGKINFVAKNFNSERKIINWCFQKWLSFIGVTILDNSKQWKKGLVEILDNLKEGNKIGIFPEGTRSRNGKLQEFNDGVSLIAEMGNCPVIPTSIKGTYELWHKNVAIKYGGDVKIEISNPLQINYDIKDKYERRKDLTQRIRESIEKGLAKAPQTVINRERINIASSCDFYG
ncbi:MAG: lysophospholipid acyltransferase family protein [archaeon]